MRLGGFLQKEWKTVLFKNFFLPILKLFCSTLLLYDVVFMLTRVVFHHVLVVPVRGRGQVHGRPERGEQSNVGRVQFGGGRADEFTDDHGIAAAQHHHSGA